MADDDGSEDRPLRAVAGTSDGADGDRRRTTADDPTAGLREALGALESKVRSPDGGTDLSQWLGDVEAIVAQIRSKEIDATRDEIRTMIDQLLELNAQVQNLVRLKQLLS